MHEMRAQEILALARCCKWTLHCADSAFAWRHCPPLYLRFHANLLGPPSPARFSRWMPITLAPDHDVMQLLSEADANLLLQLFRDRLCPRIIGLCWFEWDLTVESGLELLTHPAMQSVRDLGVDTDMRAEWLSAAASLPCLAYLSIMDSALSPADLQPLVHAHALRSLYVSEERGEYLSAVVQLTQLTWLYIYAPRLHGDNFVAFCAAMSGLEELHLAHWSPEDVRSISSADLSAGLASLRSLRTLEFADSFDAQTLAPVLHHAPALRSLQLPTSWSPAAAAFVARLLQAAPMLRLKLVCEADRERLEQAKQSLLAAASTNTAERSN